MSARCLSRWPCLSAAGMLIALLPATVAMAAPCAQTRHTVAAPAEYRQQSNPLPASRRHLRAGKQLYRGDSGTLIGCFVCHGAKGDGRGPLAARLDPPPRDFTCPDLQAAMSDGQLFWIIRYGSPRTAMSPHPDLSDEQIWQLVLYLRRFAE